MKRYEVMAIQFDGTKIYGEDFEEGMVELDYKPTLEELKRNCGKGLEFVRKFIVSEYDLNDLDYCNEYELSMED